MSVGPFRRSWRFWRALAAVFRSCFWRVETGGSCRWTPNVLMAQDIDRRMISAPVASSTCAAELSEPNIWVAACAERASAAQSTSSRKG